MSKRSRASKTSARAVATRNEWLHITSAASGVELVRLGARFNPVCGREVAASGWGVLIYTTTGVNNFLPCTTFLKSLFRYAAYPPHPMHCYPLLIPARDLGEFPVVGACSFDAYVGAVILDDNCLLVRNVIRIVAEYLSDSHVRVVKKGS